MANLEGRKQEYMQWCDITLNSKYEVSIVTVLMFLIDTQCDEIDGNIYGRARRSRRKTNADNAKNKSKDPTPDASSVVRIGSATIRQYGLALGNLEREQNEAKG